MKRLMDRIKIRSWIAIAVAWVAAFQTGCSSFHREWRQQEGKTHPAASLAGRWEGGWLSGKNSHRGKLRCVITPQGPDRYRAHFHATYWKVFRYAYPVDLVVESRDGMLRFSGQADLGTLAGGVYDYTGEMQAGAFRSTYKSKYDHGTFEMRKR